MRTTWTTKKCLERACRLMLMADAAESYQQILTYDGLAQEWLKMAARASQAWNDDAGQEAPAPRRRSAWREFCAWFR